jgi:hypothetical protein
MKKRVTAAKQAANDKPGPVEQFQPGSTGPVRTGFLPVFVRPCKAAGTIDETALNQDLADRQVAAKETSFDRVQPYIGGCRIGGILEAVR